MLCRGPLNLEARTQHYSVSMTGGISVRRTHLRSCVSSAYKWWLSWLRLITFARSSV